MPPVTFAQNRLPELAGHLLRRIQAVILVALLIGVLAALFLDATAQRAALASAGGAILLASLLLLVFTAARSLRDRDRETLFQTIADDPLPHIITNTNGDVLRVNAAGLGQLRAEIGKPVSAAFETRLADPATPIAKLLQTALEGNSALHEFGTHRGRCKLQVCRVRQSDLLWRFEEHTTTADADQAATIPALRVGQDSSILHVNNAARELLGCKPSHLDRVFTELPVTSGSRRPVSLARGTASCLVFESRIDDETRTLFLLPADMEHTNAEDWSVFERLPVSLVKVDPDGHVCEYNRMAAELVGPSLQQNAHLSDLMEGLGRPITDWIKETLAGQGKQQTEFLRLKRGDKEAFVQVGLNAVPADKGPVLIAVLTDATELKTLEAQFVQSQKMQAIGQLAGGVAHDFNNLLTAISGHCDLLLLRHDQGDPDYNDLVQINQNANRAAALVGQLLAFSRKQTLRPETLDMRNTLSDLTHLLNRLVGEKVALTLQHDPILKPIRADKRQLEQVIMNLVVNARDAMPDGGEIRIITEVSELKEPLTRDRVTVPAGHYVTVRVQDDGIGIPQDKIQKVFEPFYTTKRVGEGTGLGLSTAYGIVKQTGGFIFVDSVLGSGTVFTLYLPVFDTRVQAPEPKKSKAVRHPAKHGDGVILLVEDEAPVRAFASRALRLRGFTVLEADSAESALRTLQDDTLNIDVFVTDVVMPGMDGPTWVREALKKRPDVRVVFVSGYAEDSFGEAQTKIPNSVFLPKPFSLNDLTDTVRQQMH